jgi:hypothetical protein
VNVNVRALRVEQSSDSKNPHSCSDDARLEGSSQSQSTCRSRVADGESLKTRGLTFEALSQLRNQSPSLEAPRSGEA